jgi:hypothetical protein
MREVRSVSNGIEARGTQEGSGLTSALMKHFSSRVVSLKSGGGVRDRQPRLLVIISVSSDHKTDHLPLRSLRRL